MRAWVALCGVLGGGAAAVAWFWGLASPWHDLAGYPLAWDARRWTAEPWTLWTAAWIHTSASNLGGHLLAIVALAIAGAAVGAGRVAALALLLAWPLTTASLLLWQQVTSYGGLGGPIHAAAAVLGVHVLRHSKFKPLAALLFGGIALKLLAERGWVQPVAFDPSWGFNVVAAAHLAGTVAGAACALVLGWLEPAASAGGTRPRPPAPSP